MSVQGRQLRFQVYWDAAKGWNDTDPVDITAFVDPRSVQISMGRNITSESLLGLSPSRCRLLVYNDDGRFSPENSNSPYNASPKSIGIGRPIEVQIVDPASLPASGGAGGTGRDPEPEEGAGGGVSGPDPVAPAAPAPPSLLAGQDYFRATWIAPADNGSAITGYRLRYRSGATWIEEEISGTAPIYTVTLGSDPYTWEVQIAAVNDGGTGVWSASAYVTNGRNQPAAPDAPDAPGLAAQDTQIVASWTRPSDRGASVSGYQIEYREENGTWDQTAVPATTETHTITGLNTDTAYEVRIRAASQYGPGPFSPAATATTTGLGAVGQATATTPLKMVRPVVLPRIGHFYLEWTAPGTGGSAITGYEMRVRSKLYSTNTWPTSWKTIAIDANKSAYKLVSDTSATPPFNIGSSYDNEVQIRAKNANGNGPWSDSWVLAGIITSSTYVGVRDTVSVLIDATAPPPTYWRSAHPANAQDAQSITHLGSIITQVQYNLNTAGNWLPLNTDYELELAAGQRSDDLIGITNNSLYYFYKRFTTNSSGGNITYAFYYGISGENPFTGGNDFALTSAVHDDNLGFTVRSTKSNITISSSHPFDLLKLAGVVMYGRRQYMKNFPNRPAAPTLAVQNATTIRVTIPNRNQDWDIRWRKAGTTDPWQGYYFDESAVAGTTYDITGLAGSTEYEVALKQDLRIYNSGANPSTVPSGCCRWGAVRKATTQSASSAPDAPAAPTVTRGNAQLSVSWTAPNANNSAITDYDVQYRSGTSGAWTSWAHTGTGRTATITGLANGTSYQVQVRATNAVGTSGWSPSGTGTPATTPTAPGAPTLTAGNRQIAVSWSAPATGGSAITDYDVRYRAGTSGNWSDWAHSGTGTTATITGLTGGTSYQVAVRATNAVGSSAWSAASSATAKDVPDAPGAPTLTRGNAQIAATWSAPSNRGAAITDYDVQYRAGTSGGWTDWAHTGTGTSATITGLTNGTAYQVRVRAQNSEGESAWSAASSATPAAAPSAPAAPTLNAGNAQIVATWVAPAANGSSITDYDVQYRAGTSGGWTDWAHTGTATTATITGLTNGTAYQVRVRAENAVGDGAWSPAASATPALPTPPAVPDAPGAPGVTAGNARIVATWQEPANNRAAITDYDVQYRAGTSGGWTDWAHTGTATTATITGLTNGTAYQVRVRAENSVGEGPWSAASSSVTPATAPSAPGAPTLVRGNRTISVSWTAPATGGSAITDYDVRYRAGTSGDWTDRGHNGTSTTTTISNLTNGTAYQVAVRATNAIGSSPWSAASSATPATTPAAPAAPSVSGGAARVTVAWTAPDDGGSAITDYDVRYRTGGGSWSDWAHSGTGTTAAITGLNNGATYEVQVRATNALGSSAWSASGSDDTATVPSAPSTPTLTVGGRQLGVSWAAPGDGGSAITDYNVRYRAGGAGAWTPWPHTGTTRTTTITGLQNGTTYQVQVQAVNAVGNSPWSPSGSAAPYEVLTPGTPQAPTVSGQDESLFVEWGNVTSATDYDVQYRAGTSGAWTDYPHTGVRPYTIITPLTNGTSYQVQVRARNSAGAGSWSVAVAGTPAASADPAYPSDTLWSGYIIAIHPLSRKVGDNWLSFVELECMGPEWRWLDAEAAGWTERTGQPAEVIRALGTAIGMDTSGELLPSGDWRDTMWASDAWRVNYRTGKGNPATVRAARQLAELSLTTMGGVETQRDNRGRMYLRDWSHWGNSANTVKLTLAEAAPSSSELEGAGWVPLDNIVDATDERTLYSNFSAIAADAGTGVSAYDNGWTRLITYGDWSDFSALGTEPSTPGEFTNVTGDTRTIGQRTDDLMPTGERTLSVPSSLIIPRLAYIRWYTHRPRLLQLRYLHTGSSRWYWSAITPTNRGFGTCTLNTNGTSWNLNITKNTDTSRGDRTFYAKHYMPIYGIRYQTPEVTPINRSTEIKATKSLAGQREFPIQPEFSTTADANAWLSRVSRRYGQSNLILSLSVTPKTAAQMDLIGGLREGDRVKVISGARSAIHVNETMVVHRIEVHADAQQAIHFRIDAISTAAYHA